MSSARRITPLLGVFTLSLLLSSTAMAANTVNLTQTGAAASAQIAQHDGDNLVATVTQSGPNTLVAEQSGNGARLESTQVGTGAPLNSINYVGSGQSQTKIFQRPGNGSLTASGASGNKATVQVTGVAQTATPHTVTLDQIGFNNSSNVQIAAAGSTGYTNLSITQYKNGAGVGNEANVNVPSASGTVAISQQGGNKTSLTMYGGLQNIGVNQINTANDRTLENTADLTIAGAGLNLTQIGTGNNFGANLSGVTLNGGVVAYQAGSNNQAYVTQNGVYHDFSIVETSTITQNGTNNFASVLQNATYNSHFHINQDGNLHVALIEQTGQNHVANIVQTGSPQFASIKQQ